VQSKIAAGWEDIYLSHECLPEIDLEEVSLSTNFLGKSLRRPFVISALTGGYSEATKINGILARVAEHFEIAMEVGSQRPIIEFPERTGSYSIIREKAPNAFLIANIGAAQLIPQKGRDGYSLEQIDKLVEVIHADALAIHLNFLQEAIMIGGDTIARGCTEAIGVVARSLSVPVIVKETGSGISKLQALRLKEQGVAALDVAGAGGSNMALMESHRSALYQNQRHQKLGQSFASWGLPTAISILETKASGLPVIGSGGICSGVDGAKALALGATLVGVARPLLVSAVKGYEAVVEWLTEFFDELKIAMFLTGASRVEELSQKKVCIVGRTREWLQQSGYDLT
jgi:isopentenyl-diphosphate delta-isomerase